MGPKQTVTTAQPRPRRWSHFQPSTWGQVRLSQPRAERDALAQRVEALQQRELAHYASQHLSDAADITLGGKTLADLVDENGFIDPEAVRVAAAEVTATRPGLGKKNSPAFDPSHGLGGNAPSKNSPTWELMFKS